MERIFINQAGKEIGYKDKRSFRKWCAHYGVGILSDLGSKKQYVIKEEFEMAKKKEPLKYLNQKYGTEKLSGIFSACLNFETEYRITLEQNRKKNFQKDNYSPKGEHEKSFLARLTSKLHEL